MLASMRRVSGPGKFLCGVLLMLAALPLQARVLRMEVDALRSGAANLQGVDVRLDWRDGASTGELSLDARRLDVPALGQVHQGLRWRCPLSRDDAGRWRCEGQVRSDAGAGRLQVALSGEAIDAMFASAGASLDYGWQAGAPDRHRVDLRAVPVAWLEAFLASLWEAGQWGSGRLDGRVDLQLPADAPLRAQADLVLADVGVDTPDGWLAAAGMHGRLRLAYAQPGGQTAVDLHYSARGGEFLVGSLYVPLPDAPVELALALRGGDDGWRVPAFSWKDGRVLEAAGSARLDTAGTLADLDLSLSLGELATARDRYLSGYLAPAGFADLVLAGEARARLVLAGGELDSLSLGLERLTAIDPRQRFTLAGLHGDLRWTAGTEPVAGALAWDSAALFGIGLGHANMPFRSAGGQLLLVSPVSVAALEGHIRLDQLRWQPPGGGNGARFQLGATLEALDLGSLSQRLGWPPFTGTLGGRIPSARYEGNVLTLDGGLAMQAFGGTVSLSELVMERPFGVAPTLSAAVAIDDVDMEPMTAAFGFGSITGRMDGRIAGLRMVDWSPVAFDAWLGSDESWKGRRRISQRAVEDISKVGGGGGLMGGLQAQALRLFDDFRYARLGLGCRLRDNVCVMSGVGSAGDGYTIVEGAGLPRIQVVGFRRRVDWPTLVARLKAATEGQNPVIE
ncbi:hypothetical protein C6N40_11595 [Arenimonas caeni]|uniref:Dicarboxylate transport domain-containing protein n=2 Tax=Arenimonas caeni TaxID=2058085 RepID=A0A2P6M6M2_9GAMM|nr:hypothetical protein C6N40_11595 [Arenimonas caeni]